MFFITQYAGHAIKLAEEAIAKGASHIICIGGDGSLNEVINGVMYSGVDDLTRQSLRVGLIPNGTGNDFARTQKITPNITLLKKYIDDDLFEEIDLGLVNFTNIKGQTDTRYFINITNVGMGGVIVQKLQKYSRWMGSFLTFQRAIISTLLNYEKPYLTVQADNLHYEGEVMVFAIAKAKYFGGGLGIAIDAEPANGFFSLIIIGKISMLQYIKLLPKVRNCKRLYHSEIKYHKASVLNISATEKIPIDMDGEFIGYTPMHIKLIPAALKFLCNKL